MVIITGLRAATRQWWVCFIGPLSPCGCRLGIDPGAWLAQRPVRTHAPNNRLRRSNDGSSPSCVRRRSHRPHNTHTTMHGTNANAPFFHHLNGRQAQSKQGERSALPLIQRRPSQTKPVRGYLRREARQAAGPLLPVSHHGTCVADDLGCGAARASGDGAGAAVSMGEGRVDWASSF